MVFNNFIRINMGSFKEQKQDNAYAKPCFY